MHKSSTMAIIANDLDSMAHRIEALEGHPSLTDALVCVRKAKAAVLSASVEIHHRDMKARFAADGYAPSEAFHHPV